MALRVAIVMAAALALVTTSTDAKEPPRLSIPDLLNPETRLETWRKFFAAEEPEKATAFEFNSPYEFARPRIEVRVEELRRAGQDPRYLVLWQSYSTSELATWPQLRRSLAGPGAADDLQTVPTTRDSPAYRLFTAQGEPLPSPPSGVNRAVYGDFDGDGEPDLIDDAHVKENGLEGEMLIVRRIPAGSKPSLAILFNTHKPEYALGNTWGFQVRNEAGEGAGHSIELGPARADGSVTPEVVFRWNPAAHRWDGPAPALDAHYRVLRGDPVPEASQILRAGGLGYPLSPTAPPVAVDVPAPRLALDLGALPSDRLSKPYRYSSLKGRGDQALFDFFGRRKSVADFLRERVEAATAVPEFWDMPPREAARAYVAVNHPPELRWDRLFDFEEPFGPSAPKAGGLTLSAQPATSATLSGAFGIYHLQCAREGSFILYSEVLPCDTARPLIERVTRVRIQRADLPYTDALSLLQTAWWMSAVRGRKLSDQRDEYGVLQFQPLELALQFSIPGQQLSWAGDSFAGFPGQFLGLGPFRQFYGPPEWARLLLQVFQRELPARLGAAWPSPELANFDAATAAAQSPAELERERQRAAEVLQLFREGRVPAAAAVPAIVAAGEHHWREMREEIAGLAPSLPPPSRHEQQVAKYEAELKRWREKLGKDASESAVGQRNDRRSPEVARFRNPGARVEPLTPEERQKFDEYDRLVRLEWSKNSGASAEDLGHAALRQAIARTLRQLDAWDRPGQLQALALDDRECEGFAAARLAALDRSQAIALLKKLEERNAGWPAFERARESRFRLEEATQSPQARLQASCLLLRTGDVASWELLRLAPYVAPPEDPARYADPLVDDAVTRAVARIRQETAVVTRELAVAAARRMGECAWAPLMVRGGKGPIGMAKVLPGLAMVAAAEPEQYRNELRKILEDQVTASRGGMDYIAWAIWRTDLRELKKTLEGMATSGPDDYDGPLGRESSSWENPRPYRYHSARHVAAIWNEEDPLTRAKLAVAFAVHHAGELQDDRGALALICEEVKNARGQLDAIAMTELEKFQRFCASRAAGRQADLRLVVGTLANP